MEYTNRWEILRELGSGGQGKVYRVCDKTRFDLRSIREGLIKAVGTFNSITTHSMRDEQFAIFRRAILDMIAAENPEHHGALKVLHSPKDAGDADRAHERLKNEITAMSEMDHERLLKIIDHDVDGRWYVSQFCSKGTLSTHPDIFQGDVRGTLEALRPVVDGVSKLHDSGIVHRDIKPQNIFLDTGNLLVLGDFGLIFFTDNQQTRLSATFENVGSRDWMPGWAQGVRIAEVRPTFDVFSIGKVAWSMISGRPLLQLWYFDRDAFNIERLFPGDQSMRVANDLFRRCIVENEKDCLENASALLKEMDQALSVLRVGADVVNSGYERACRVCGIGQYRFLVDREPSRTENFGLKPGGTREFKIFGCGHCGHVQLFTFAEGEDPTAWKAKQK